jgi:hypothetical protein
MPRLPLLWSLGGLSFVGMLLIASTAWPQAQNSIGRVTALEGEATVLRQGQFAAEPLTLQRPVFQEDIIETGPDTKVRITLIDTTVISLGEQSRLELRRFAYDAREHTRTASLTVAAGIFRAIINTLVPSSTFEVTTPTAIADIRGTDLMGEVTPNSTAIVVLEGTVTISNVRPIFRGLATLTPGTGMTVTADQAPATPTRWSTSRIEALQQATTAR